MTLDTTSRYRTLLNALLIVWVTLLSATFAATLQAQDFQLSTQDDNEFSITHFAADGDYLLLWIAPEYGFKPRHRSLAKQLAERGIEVWQSNILEGLFLTQNVISQRKLDGRHSAELAQLAHQQTAKKVFIVGDAYAASTALMAARHAQQTGPAWLGGVVLFTPSAYATIPPLGQTPEFMPIVDASNVPMMIYQAQKSLTSVRFGELKTRLQAHGSPIYSQTLPAIMGLFYDEENKPETIAAEQTVVHSLPAILPRLAAHNVPGQVPALAKRRQKTDSGIDVYLQEYRGKITPQQIRLAEANGGIMQRDDFTNRVTLVNFWATWCPPCVEEIPSLNRLQQAMQDQPFELISINYAEQPQDVKAFLRKVDVDFPVLLDVDGSYARQWNVVTYPSTFVIDRSGAIRYGVNAAIDWDDPALIARLKQLAAEG